MKLPQTITILAFTAVLTAMTIPAALAQQSPQATPDPQQQAQPQTPDSETGLPATIQTFQGTISRSQGQYVLNSASGAIYQLDDQKRAKEYAGKSVKVTGTLDASGDVIHVSSIEPAS
jgi:Protein of unknown function (DUF5818)